MGIEENSEIAKKIYIKHRDLFDYIFEIKPDGINDINQVILDCLQSNGYKLGSVSKSFIRFYHQDMEQYIYINNSHKFYQYIDKIKLLNYWLLYFKRSFNE